LILVVAGAAAALAPGLPLRDWFAGLLEPEVPTIETPVLEPVREGPAAPSPAAVSVDPEEGRIQVRLEGFAPESNVHVRLTDSPDARVRVEGQGAGARFVVAPGTVKVVGGDGGEIWVELPRAAAEAAVEIDGELAVIAAYGRLQLSRPAADTLEDDVVFRVGD
jgi:hypothetical protein